MYVAAEKYGVDNLKPLIYDKMSSLLNYGGEKTDLVETIETIIENTPENDALVRPLLVNHCVEYLGEMREKKDFMDLLTRVGDVGAALVARLDLFNGRV